MPSTRIEELIDKLLRNQCTPGERQELFQLVEQTVEEDELRAVLENAWNRYDRPSHTVADDTAAAIVQKILNGDKVVEMYPRQKRSAWYRLAVAASVLLAISIGGYFLFFKESKKPEIVQTTILPNDVKAPETSRALITLANGEKVYLDSVGNGQLAMQGNVQLVKLANGQIVYSREPGAGSLPAGQAGREIQYNTLMNPRGSKVIDMILADGSRVWLNAGSSVTYPVAFVGNERKVSITGEGYFEVAHDDAKPFKVAFTTPSGNGGEVMVLGTHFNVNAYNDEEAVRVTLLEGSVKVTELKTQNSRLISPGQQAQIAPSDIQLINPNLEQVMAWKNGRFQFDGAGIEEVMRQLARWYDVEVKYEGAIPKHEFNGKIGKSLTLDQVLKGLAKTGVKYKIENGNSITIMQQ